MKNYLPNDDRCDRCFPKRTKMRFCREWDAVFNLQKTRNNRAGRNQRKLSDWCSLKTATDGRRLGVRYRINLAGDASREALDATSLGPAGSKCERL